MTAIEPSERRPPSHSTAAFILFQRFTISLGVFLLVSAMSLRLSGQVVDDFDKLALNEVWTAIGETTTARRLPVPKDLNHPGVAGHYVDLKLKPGGLLVTRADFELPDFRKAAFLKLRIQATRATKAEPSVLELRLFSGERRASRWCKVELSDSQWHTIELPLRFFRQSRGAFVDWPEVKRLGLATRNEEQLRLDRIEFALDEQGIQSQLAADEIRQLAFGNVGTVNSNTHFDLITNVPEFDHASVLTSLDKLHDRITRAVPDLSKTANRVPLLVFATEQEYRRFFERLGARLRADIQPPQTQGYTVFGIACCVFSIEFGAVRPIYLHESCHALLARRLGLRNQGEWLHEGWASHFQTTLLGQDRRAPARHVLRQPVDWSTLLSGDRIELHHYAHAMFFVEWLVAEPKRKERFFAALKQLRKQGNSQFEQRIVELMDRTEAELQASYKRYVESALAKQD